MAQDAAQFEQAQANVHRANDLLVCKGWTDGLRPYIQGQIDSMTERVVVSDDISDAERNNLRAVILQLRHLAAWPEKTKAAAVALLETRKPAKE